MAENSKIEWTDHTFNPWEGCCKVSPGCHHCYAEARAYRFGLKVWGPTAPRRPRADAGWREPVKWNREAAAAGVRRRVFCASIADVFEGPETCQDPAAYQVITEGRRRLWNLICATPHLDWLLLTKRPENILRFTPGAWEYGWPAHVWVGTSVENQKTADQRIYELLKVPATVRFLSMEPLLGPVDLDRPADPAKPTRGTWLRTEDDCPTCEGTGSIPVYEGWQFTGGATCPTCNYENQRYMGGSLIHWVIVGGESGKKARPMHPDWARSLRDQCQSAGVPFFFKQWGEHLPADQVGHMPNPDRSSALHFSTKRVKLDEDKIALRVGKSIAGRLLDGRTWDEMPEVARA